MTKAVEAFISYTHKDDALRERLTISLKMLERQGRISTWHDRRIAAGSEWKEAIDTHLETSALILLLISPDFIASDYCFDIEMQRAVKRHDNGEAIVIPIILRPADWKGSPFAKLQALPRDGKPVSTYADRDVAYQEVTTGIRSLLDERFPLSPAPTPLAVSLSAPEILPVTSESPLLAALAIDVSGSMQESIGGLGGAGANRLQGVLQSIEKIAGAANGNGPAPVPSNLVRIFAYGFGFTDRAAEYGALAGLARRFLGDKVPSLPSRIYRGEVRDLFEIAGLGARSLLLGELRDGWEALTNGLWEQRVDLFGQTPMAKAMEMIDRRFADESRAYKGTPRKLLLFISDGDSTDTSPIQRCQQMQREGVTIACGYITSSDVTAPRRLYSEVDPTWPPGGATLFNCSSQVGEELRGLGLLLSEPNAAPIEKWQFDAKSRLFLQINHSEVLSEFLTAMMNLHMGQGTSDR